MPSSSSPPAADVEGGLSSAVDTGSGDRVPVELQDRWSSEAPTFISSDDHVLRQMVPGPVRASSIANAGATLLSPDLFAQYSEAIAGPIVELVYPSSVLLEGVLRAAKHKDALLVIELPRPDQGEEPAHAHQMMVAEIKDAILHTQYERPLALLSSGWSLRELCRGPVEEQMFQVYDVVEAGFTSVRLHVDDDVGHRGSVAPKLR